MFLCYRTLQKFTSTKLFKIISKCIYATSQQCMSFTGSYKYLSEYFCIYLFLFLEGRKKTYTDALYSPLREMSCPSKEKKNSARWILYQKFSYDLRCTKELTKSWTLLIKVGNNLTDAHILLTLIFALFYLIITGFLF